MPGRFKRRVQKVVGKGSRNVCPRYDWSTLFRIAGAETVLASHWKVNDKATSQLMTEFMRRWRSGEPRATAWCEAHLSLLHSKDFSNPYFWSAFTLTATGR